MHSKHYAEDNPHNRNRGSLEPQSWFDYCRRIADFLDLCIKIKQERKSLATLTDAELADIGLHPSDVHKECSRAFFEVPTHRLE
ncbi:MAG: DUF1127 domain-containing protein [Pseudomonadota bacterium]